MDINYLFWLLYPVIMATAKPVIQTIGEEAGKALITVQVEDLWKMFKKKLFNEGGEEIIEKVEQGSKEQDGMLEIQGLLKQKFEQDTELYKSIKEAIDSKQIEYIGEILLEPLTENDWVNTDLKGERYKPNGVFNFNTAFRLIPNANVYLETFQAIYFAKGCPCLQKEPKLKISERIVELFDDWKTIKEPVILERGKQIILSYSRLLQPSLMIDSPFDSNYGDLEIQFQLRTIEDGLKKEVVRRFEFTKEDILKPIKQVRSVP